MTAGQERRLIRAALDFVEADARVRASRHDIHVSRKGALYDRRLAKARLITAAGLRRPQPELPLHVALPVERPRAPRHVRLTFTPTGLPGRRISG